MSVKCPAHTRFGYKLGPTSVGKGFEEKLEKRTLQGLINQGLTVEWISFGQIIRDKLKSDPTFERLHGKTVKKGKLLPDEPAIDIFTEATDRIFQEGEPDLVLVDGFCRSVPQIVFATENRFVDDRDYFYFLEAKKETCLFRFLGRAAKMEEKRKDQELRTFYSRYALHRRTIGDLHNSLREARKSPTIVEVDANQDIAEFVHPHILQTLLPVAFRQMAARRRRSAPKRARVTA
jgi:adenylate kinase family enzyme